MNQSLIFRKNLLVAILGGALLFPVWSIGYEAHAAPLSPDPAPNSTRSAYENRGYENETDRDGNRDQRSADDRSADDRDGDRVIRGGIGRNDDSDEWSDGDSNYGDDGSNDRSNPRYENDANVRLHGVVQRDLAGRDRFTVRLENGRIIEVISRRSEPVRLSKGDHVELRGDFERGLFIADSVRLARDSGAGWNRPVVLRGRVLRDYRGRDFEIRTDRGRVMTVSSLGAEPIRLSRGDLVEVRGRFQDSIFLARDVDILHDNGGWNQGQQSVDFPATILRRESSRRLVVRGDNGRIYSVVADFSLNRFDHDDRVRVRGVVSRGVVTASQIELWRGR